MARNVILKYSSEGELILDPMVGSGTTLIEAKILGRKGIGVDINEKAINITRERIKIDYNNTESNFKLFNADARNLYFIKDESIDLILTHPPYLNIISYSEGKIDGDLSNISGVKKFCDELEIIIAELYRVLKPNRYCAILIGDTRKGRHYVPLAYYVMERFLNQGFALKEDIIKIQHNCKTTEGIWRNKANQLDFYLIMHEHLFVFRKPKPNEDLSKIRYSIKK
ncbi:TRM11 family methyltransferase [Carboxydocella sp. ULO1]|uniref:TRM11 family SAM-dependent methyltransferase n=1 Tax=Carboxydocella sp. ULO1 TaxID=1926599 RepID=UPI0027D81BE9|nr:DNA methyltransferase [Carboxydocella sp. ULO1]